MKQNLTPPIRRQQYQLAADAVNRFTADLYSHVAAMEGNLFASPFSIHAALSMALVGARGETARQMAKVLRQPPELHDASLADIVACEVFEEPGVASELVTANALWAQKGLHIRPEFAAANAGRLREVDFTHASEEARTTINDWVARQTRDKIRDLLAPGCLSELTRLILTNAIYFRADWRAKFDPTQTINCPFHLKDGTTVDVPMMHQTADFRVFEDDRFQAINLSYEGFQMSMQVFVPRKIDQLPWLEKAILTGSPATWQEKMQWRRADLSLPRFRFETSLTVAQNLIAMGMVSAFDANTADFTGITDDPFWLSDVIHKTYVNVDEEGTEAAGATAAIMCGGIGADYPPAVVTVDRPFLLTIRGQSQLREGAVLLFVGRVVDPRG